MSPAQAASSPKPGRPHAAVDTAASLVLVGLGAALAATALFFVLQRDSYLAGATRVFCFVALPAALALAAFAAAPSARRRPLALIALLFTAAIYTGELALSAGNWRAWNQVLERSDPRSKVAVLEELRAAGHDAWPAVFPASLAGSLRSGSAAEELRSIFPLGGVPEVDSVYCGEGRAFVVYRSDRFGFFNPETAFAARPRVLLLGDSYVQGHCVGADEQIAARLRRQFPGALNFAMNGNGPLAELATLREYGPLLRPEFVVWGFFAGNDFQNLESEKQTPELSAYLDPAHRQGLAERRDAVDAALRAHVANEKPRASRAPLAQNQGLRATLGDKLLPILSLHNLLPFLGLPYGRIDFDYALFREILESARDEVASWDGELLFAYLPLTSDFYGLNRYRSGDGIVRQRTLAIARELGLRSIDLHPAIAALPDPMAVSSTPRTHYDALGYELAAREIAATLSDPR